MKELELTLQVRNNRIKARRVASGLSQSAAAEACGIALAEWNGLETFRIKPLNRKGRWRPIAVRVAAYLLVEPDELWPEALRELDSKRLASLRTCIDVHDFSAIGLSQGSQQLALPPGAAIDVSDILDAIHRLKRREVQILEGYFWEGRTWAELATDLGVSVERVRQIQLKALARLRQMVGRDETADELLEKFRKNKRNDERSAKLKIEAIAALKASFG